MLRFRSRIALWLLRAAIALPVMMVLGGAVFELGDCVIGLTQRGGCAYLPDWLGEVAMFAALAGYVLSLYLAPVLIIVGALMEFLARQR